MKNTQLIIFDLDGTIIQNPLFYKTVYSQSLNELIEEMRGERGLEALSYYRKNFQGRGELALFALTIPYSVWAEKLDNLSLDLIQQNKKLVNKIQQLPAKKVIYTGSPLKLTKRLLQRIGLKISDFDEIIAWKKSEEFPLKWTCSPFIFSSLAKRYRLQNDNVLVIGDSYQTDIFPALQAGIRAKQIKEATLEQALNVLWKENYYL